MTPSTAVRRAALALAFAPALFARVAVAQNSQVSLADAGHRFISPGLQGFEARRKSGIGRFITDSVLRDASGMRLANLLEQHIPSIMFGSNNLNGEFPISTRVCGGGLACAAPRCYVRVFMDGTLTFDGSPRLRDLEGVDVSHLRTQDFSGIEYYSSAAGLPAQYAGQNTDCGTLLLWSRET